VLPNDRFFATLEGADDKLLLHWMAASERLGRLPEYELEIYTEARDLALDGLIGEPLTVCVARTGDSIRYYNGIVTRIWQTGVRERFRVIRATVSPKLWLAQHARDCRVFEDATVPEVVKAVLDPRYLPVSLDRLYAPAYKKWDYLVQYRESDFAFISRLLEQEGIYYYFHHTRTLHTMVLADSVSSHYEVAGYEAVPLVLSGVHTPMRDHLTNWQMVHESRSARASLQAHDFRFKGGANILGTGRAEPNQFRKGEDKLEVYDYAEHFVVLENKTESEANDQPFSVSGVRGEGDRYAKNLVDAEGTDREWFEGEGNLRGLEVGALFRIVAADAPAGRLLVVSTTCTVRSEHIRSGSDGGAAGGEKEPCVMSFSAISENVQFRSARATPKPVVAGPETAIVVGLDKHEIETDKYGRIRVRFHWDRQERSSCWLRVVQTWAGTNWGTMFIPRVGQEVVVEFLGGDPDRPIVMGSVYNADHMPPYDLPQHATVSTIKTRSTPEGTATQYNEIRFHDKKGSEQVFLHSQGRMDAQVRGSLYETVGGNREERVGRDDKGDFNRLVANDINEHGKGGRFELVDKKLNQNVKLEVVEVFESSHTVAVTDRQTLNAKEIAIEAKQTLSLKGDGVTMQGAKALSLKAGNVKIEGTQSISLKCGGNFIVLTPSGVFINGAMVFINTGGGPQPADAPLVIQDPTIETPLDAAAATSGIPGSTSPGGGGGGAGPRTRTSRSVALQRAPEPPPPPPAGPRVVLGASADRAFIDIAWVEKQTYCGGPATLHGATRGYSDGSSETADIRNVVDGATVVGVPIAITGNAFNQNVEIKDWLPRQSGSNFETTRDEDAFAAGQKTPSALTMKFVPNVKAGDCAIVSPTGIDSHFAMEVKNYECQVAGALSYVKGYMAWIIQLGDTVPAGTDGQIGLNWGAPKDDSYTGSDWRFCKDDSASPTSMSFWDGSRWQPVPAAWRNKGNVKLCGMGIWREGTTNKAQYGGTWPDRIPNWGPTEQALANTTFPTWSANTASTWSQKFDLRRSACSSANQKCCRYSVRVGISLVEVTTKSGNTIVVAANNGRSNSEAWSLGDTRPGLAPHEFGHHLGNPDEYLGGGGIDTSVNTDGAAAGIDGSCLMGSVPNSGIPPVKARHFNIVKQHLTALIQSQEGVTWTFDAVPHI
jgi:type VI secretion system VgrG family protein